MYTSTFFYFPILVISTISSTIIVVHFLCSSFRKIFTLLHCIYLKLDIFQFLLNILSLENNVTFIFSNYLFTYSLIYMVNINPLIVIFSLELTDSNSIPAYLYKNVANPNIALARTFLLDWRCLWVLCHHSNIL